MGCRSPFYHSFTKGEYFPRLPSRVYSLGDTASAHDNIRDLLISDSESPESILPKLPRREPSHRGLIQHLRIQQCYKLPGHSYYNDQ